VVEGQDFGIVKTKSKLAVVGDIFFGVNRKPYRICDESRVYVGGVKLWGNRPHQPWSYR